MSNHSGYSITGTDTEVGKTLVCGALIVQLRARGKSVLGFKPVVAGTYQGSDGQLLNEDIEALRTALGNACEGLNLCPYILNTPAAPHLVAKSEGMELKLEVLMKSFRTIEERCDCVVTEGAGGFLTPLNESEDLGKFAEQIGLPIILVVGLKLGCINHAILTVEAIQSRNLRIAGWIGNTLTPEMQFLSENIETLCSKIDAPFLGLIPELPSELKEAAHSPYTIEALECAAQHIQLPK